MLRAVLPRMALHKELYHSLNIKQIQNESNPITIILYRVNNPIP